MVTDSYRWRQASDEGRGRWRDCTENKKGERRGEEEEMGRIFADVTIDRAERVGPSRYLKR
jgi:2-keto-4-pentenoate hydratase